MLMPKNLKEARILMTTLMAQHVVDVNVNNMLGPNVRLAEGEGMDRKTAKDPTSDHMKGSLHDIGLAKDMDIYINGGWRPDSEAHEESGKLWESRHPLCRNRRHKGDGNHYSLAWENKA